MAETFIKILRLTLQKPGFLPPDRRLLLAVSGGADSVALLHTLCSLRHDLNLILMVATLDHGIRPEGQADAAWVKALAEGWGVPAFAGRLNVPELAAADGVSVETAARRYRYRFLAQLAAEQGFSAVVTAHHANDQAETVLMHLMRGAGLQGLAAMALVSSLPEAPALMLLRPMLGIRRDEVLAYCRAHQLSFRDDHTNADTRYFRNAVRHEVLPLLQSFNPQIVDALARLAESVRADLQFLQACQQEQLDAYTVHDNDGSIALDFNRWQVAHEALQRRWLLAVHHILAPQHQLDAHHITTALALLGKGRVDRFATLPGFVRVGLRYGIKQERQVVAQLAPRQKATYPSRSAMPTAALSEEPIEIGGMRLSLSNAPVAGALALRVPGGSRVSVRTRRHGDRWQPPGLHGHHQKLNEWFVDHKIPRQQRDTVPLVVVDDQIAAVLLPSRYAVAAPFQFSSPDHGADSVIRYVLAEDI